MEGSYIWPQIGMKKGRKKTLAMASLFPAGNGHFCDAFIVESKFENCISKSKQLKVKFAL